jgi:hypothetical protein
MAVLVKGADCDVTNVEVRDDTPSSVKSTRATGHISFTAKYALYCNKPAPGGPLKGVDSMITIGQAGQSPTNTDMPTTDPSGRTQKTIDPLPSRYIGEFVKISVAGRDGTWHEVGTSDVPKPK